MIERTSRGVLIPEEDIPAFLGMIGGFINHMESDVKPDLPGSFQPFYDHIMNFACRADKAAKTKWEGTGR